MEEEKTKEELDKIIKEKKEKEYTEAQAAAKEDAAAQAAADRSENLIEKANAAAKRIEDANKKHEDMLIKQEQMKVEEALGGETNAGSKEKTKEEEEIEGAKELLKGTGFEDMFEPPKEK